MGVGLLTLSMLMNEFPMTDVGFLTSMERDSKAIQQGGFGGGSSSGNGNSNAASASATNSNSQVKLIDTPSRRRLKLRALLKANHSIELALLPAHFEQARLNKSRIIGSGSSSEVHLQADVYIFHGGESSTPIVEPLVADERISVLLSPKMSGSELRALIIGALAPKKEEMIEGGSERSSVTATAHACEEKEQKEQQQQQQQQQEKDDNGKGPINAVADISQYSLHIRLPSRSWISIPFDDTAVVALCAGQRLIETMLVCCVAPDRKL